MRNNNDVANEATNDTSNEKESKTASVFESGSTVAGNGEERFYCLSIIGQIEGHYISDEKQKATKYEHLIPILVTLEESVDIDGVLIILNTMGGDVEAGLAIAELIASMTKPTVSLVLGGGHSIGVPLAVSAKKSFIVPSATMTIHPMRTIGTVISAPQTFDYLRKMQDRIVDFIVRNSRVERSYIEKIMMKTDQLANDIGSVLDGNSAVKCGLIDKVGGLSDALSCLREMSTNKKEISATQKKSAHR